MMRFGLLGAVAVECGGELASVRWPMPRSVLAALLLSANRVVPADRLVDVVWGDTPPASAIASLHNHVMRLRALLARTAAGRIRTVAPGYLIEIGDGDLDLGEFTRLYRSGRRALESGNWEIASRDLAAALGLWRGEPLEDVTSCLLRERDAPHLEQMRLDALEARIDADLRLDRQEELTAELTGLTAAHPLRERFHAQLMLAHAQAGQPAAALSAFQRVRELLAEQLGTDPGPDLRTLHQQILAGSVRLAAAPRWEGAVLPAQVPADLEDFTGRARDVRLLAELAGSAGNQPGIVPVCVVTGSAGIGKTSLAVHVAHQLRHRFPDGQLYAQLGASRDRPAGSGQVLGAFLRGLGADPGKIPAGEPERAAMFRTMLAGRRVLIVLDDAGDTPHVTHLLPGTAGCAVLVTSRSPLTDLPAAGRLRLAGFTAGDSLGLLSRIIGAERFEAETAAAEKLAELCEGLPLALRIAGVRLAARPHWRLADLAARLADPAGRLDELAVGGLSVRASFAAGYGSLRSDPAGSTLARAFRLLGMWNGPEITPSTVAALLGTDVTTTGNVLETLMDRHLLESAGMAGSYRFPGLLGIYAAEQARKAERAARIHVA